MAESVYNQFHWIMDNRLTWQDFQVLCHFHLNSIGYSANLGQIPGSDRGHDIYGTGPHGTFIAHSTIQRKGIRTKLRQDITKGVQKCLSLNKPKQEIIFFSRNSVFDDPVEETNYIEEKLLPELIEIEPRYNKIPPIVYLKTGDQLIREIASLSINTPAYNFLLSRVKTILNLTGASDDEISLLEEFSHSTSPCSEEHFLDIMHKYDADLPSELKEEMLHDILHFSWEMVVYRPFCALKLLQVQDDIPVTLRVILLPLCNISLGKAITSEDVVAFLSTLSSDHYFISGEPTHQHHVLVRRLVKWLFYQHADILAEQSIRDKLAFFAVNGGAYWELFFIDLYLRNVCNYLILPDFIASTLKQLFLSYKNRQPEKPISKLWAFLSTPIEAQRKYTQDEFLNKIINIAKECQNVIECRWCLSSLLRIMPLYSITEEELDYVDMVRTVIESFDHSIANNSPHLQYAYLNNLIRGFLRTKNLELLRLYEDKFLERHGKLLPPQRTQLQMEYASCLYVALQFKNIEDIALLRFGQLIESKRILLEHTLFRNYLVLNKQTLAINPTRNNIGTVYRWLTKYSATIYRLYARTRIERNLLTAREYRASTRVYQNRLAFGQTLIATLKTSLKLYARLNPSFYAHSLRTFSLIPKHRNIELMLDYLKYAIEADKYSILRNAKDFGEAIYSCFYYGDPSVQPEMTMLAERFAKLSDIGSDEAKLHWAYFAGIKYDFNNIEGKFLKQLGEHTAYVTRKIQQLALKRGEEVSVIFPDTIITLTRQFAERRSLFAEVLSSDIINPDIWNIMGTTLFNNANGREAEQLTVAADFYSFAKCFTRNRKDYDQKYCYNYIRCASLAYKYKAHMPNNFFVRDIVFYISRPEAYFFNFKELCAKPFFELLEHYWNDLPIETRRIFIDQIEKIDWVKKELELMHFNSW